MRPELREVLRLRDCFAKFGKTETLCEVLYRDQAYPVVGITIGSRNLNAPVLCMVGGVHGLERIGSQVLISWLNSIERRLDWDQDLHEQLKHIRLVFIPLLNPVGLQRITRSNGNGVDLMRNSPVLAKNPTFAVGGQLVSAHLPWFRGEGYIHETKMERESKALIEFFERETHDSNFVIALDLHSGFGLHDQLWYPYAHSKDPFPHLNETLKLKDLFRSFSPNHFYRFEPQAKHYQTHGDLWDYLHIRWCHAKRESTFIPLTLEMGSWNWVKKNPIQFLSADGAFNPIKPHRKERVLRRHYTLFDFLIRATRSNQNWIKINHPAVELMY